MRIGLPLVLPHATQVLESMGGSRSGREVRTEAQKCIAWALANAPRLAAPAAVAEIVAISGDTDAGLLLENGETMPCDAAHFHGADRLAVGVTTLGPLLEREVSRLFACSDPLRALALDCVGTITLRSAGSALREAIANDIVGDGCEIGARVSPGCAIVPLEAQRAVFNTARPSTIGVTLTDSLLMTPIKTISLLFPMAPNLPARLSTFNMCRTCMRRNSCASIRL